MPKLHLNLDSICEQHSHIRLLVYAWLAESFGSHFLPANFLTIASSFCVIAPSLNERARKTPTTATPTANSICRLPPALSNEFNAARTCPMLCCPSLMLFPSGTR